MPNPMDTARETLESDLRAFANPRTDVSIDVIGSSFRVGWRQGREERHEVFAVDEDDRLVWVTPNGERAPYRTFLRSRTMADYEHLSEAIGLKYPGANNFVAPHATVEDVVGSVEKLHADLPAMSAMVKARLAARPGSTTVYFVKGDAGAGKTTLLQQLVTAQAREYASHGDRTGFLFFYVSAQGRLLSNLPDVLAAETQDISAAFRNDAVGILARQGILVPIIDGFDELIGTAGYSDAFSSLQGLLGTLGGRGVIIVSARSSFYEAEFVNRGQYFDESAYSVVPLSLFPWSDEQLNCYLGLTSSAVETRSQVALLGQLGAEDRELLHRPFFASAYPDYAARRLETGLAPPVLDHLIDRYIEREAGKIVDATANPLLPPDRHRQIFEEAAETMWMNGDRKLSTDDLKTIALVIAEDANLRGSDVTQFETKITSYAGFTLDPRNDSFGFEHEVYFDYFLAQAVGRSLASGSIGGFLDRGVLPERVLTSVASAFRSGSAMDTLAAMSTSSGAHQNRRVNVAGLIRALGQRHGTITDKSLRHANFIGVELDGIRFERCAFEDCSFVDVSMRSTCFTACSAKRCTFAGMLFDSKTHFDLAGVDPYRDVSSVVDVDTGDEQFAPADVRSRLQQAGFREPELPVPVDLELGRHGKAVVAVLHRLARRFQRTTLAAPDDDDGSSRIFDASAWPVVRGLLLKHGLIREGTRPASGRRKTFIRPAVNFRDLLQRERSVSLRPEDPLDAFWIDVRSLDR